uniref:T9SS type A sorting domain-containing protein n=1 Tax=candidate division WOR-3 bacterium TaxID=2052148 RepID=A0A7C4U6K9_UNCW3
MIGFIIIFVSFEDKFWIFFKDKGEIDKNSLIKYEENIPEITKERRKNSMGKTIDYGDIPVFEEYIKKIKNYNVKIVYRSKWLNAISVLCGDKTIESIKTFPFVKNVQPVKIMRMLIDLNSLKLDYGDNNSNMRILRLDTLHSLGYTGKGIRIGILDTGFEFGENKHNALLNVNVIGKADFVFPDTIVINGDTILSPDTIVGYEPQEDWRDENYPLCFWGFCSQTDHGTEILSILAGYSKGNIIGVAFNADYILAKTELVYDRGGNFIEIRREEDNWIAACEWAESLGAHIITSSLGYKFFDDGTGYTYSELDGEHALITIAADSAVRRGVFVVNAMGNVQLNASPDTSIVAPADGKYVFSIGGIDTSGKWSNISAKGPTIDGRIKPDFVAPVTAKVVNPEYSKEIENIPGFDTIYIPKYINASGTSISTPYVSGLIALLLEAHPSWIGNVSKVKNILILSASKNGIPDDSMGYGYIDALKALRYENVEVDYSSKIGRLIVFPNPLIKKDRSILNISYFLSNEGLIDLKIFDASGKNVYRKNLGLKLPGECIEKIDVKNFLPGLYIAVISTEKFKIYGKFVII